MAQRKPGGWPTRLQVLLGCAVYYQAHAIGTPACPACPVGATVRAAIGRALTAAFNGGRPASQRTARQSSRASFWPPARSGAQRCHGVPPPRLWLRGCGGYCMGSLPCGRGGCCVGSIPGSCGSRQLWRSAGIAPGGHGGQPRPRPPASTGCDFWPVASRPTLAPAGRAQPKRGSTWHSKKYTIGPAGK